MTNLFEFLGSEIAATDGEEAFDTVCLDFAKAFDKVTHKVQLKKLTAHGAAVRLLARVENWLSNRQQNSP